MISKASYAKTVELRDRWFSKATHPYAAMDAFVQSLLAPESTLLDAGCERAASVSAQLRSVTFGRLVSLERQSLIKVGRKLTLTLADRTLLIRAALETASDLSLDWLSQFETKRCH